MGALHERQLADHPAVEEGHHAGVEVDEEVAGVRVGVEEAVDEQHLHGCPQRGVTDRGDVEPGGAHRVDVGDLDAADELLRDDALPDRLRSKVGMWTPAIGSMFFARRSML